MLTPLPPFPSATPAVLPTISWTERGELHTAFWRSERSAAPPHCVVLADDTTSADSAYRLACEGCGLLWRGDFQNARLLLQAMARRVDKPPKAKRAKKTVMDIEGPPAGQAFHLHRQAQAQRARVLGMLLVPFGADYGIALPRAPDARQACVEAWGDMNSPMLVKFNPDSPEPVEGLTGKADAAPHLVASLREFLGVVSAHEWRKKGLEIAPLGKAPNNRIHPHYGVFSPLRSEYIGLVSQTPLPCGGNVPLAFDIGTGTGVLAAVLVHRGVGHLLATDLDPRALACARENMTRLHLTAQVEVIAADLFPPGQASLVVCNPPWLPARPSAPLERAVYDEGSRMLLGFLKGLAAHLLPGGEGWLILSNLAEHLGLRAQGDLLQYIADAGLKVLGKLDAKPQHPRSSDPMDALHMARSAEVTSLWRLAAV